MEGGKLQNPIREGDQPARNGNPKLARTRYYHGIPKNTKIPDNSVTNLFAPLLDNDDLSKISKEQKKEYRINNDITIKEWGGL
jgi:hypothetical protein